MRCDEVERLIPDWSVGNLSRRLHARVQEHIELCSTCRATLEELDRAMAAVVESMRPVEPPPGLWNGVYNSITASGPARRRHLVDRIFLRPRRALSIAAGVAALASAAFFGVLPSIHETTARVPEPAAIEYVQGHLSAATHDAFADRVGLGLVVALPASQEREPL